MSTDDYQRLLGLRLRAVRAQRGLSLHAVERKSEGKWKAVVVGSYERGDRAVTVQKLAALATFYDIPLRDLIPEPRSAPVGDSDPAARRGNDLLVLDLDRLARIEPQRVGPLARYAAAVARSAGNNIGGTLPIGADELRSLAVIYGTTPGELADRLHHWGVLRPASSTSARQVSGQQGGQHVPTPRSPSGLVPRSVSAVGPRPVSAN
jgi:transcriptional regulator with XRE-family HTH domain